MRGSNRPSKRGWSRGQSNVVGVALLLAITAVSLGLLTASIGAVVEGNAARADAVRVAADLDAALQPVEATGRHRGHVSFAEGTLRPVVRDLRILNESGVVRRVSVGGLVFTAGDHRVAAVAGAIVIGSGEGADLYRPPPITASRGSGVLIVGAARLNETVTIGGSGGVETVIRTRVVHDRERLETGNYSVAIETATPTAWRPYFERQNATVTVRDFDGDGVQSVVAAYPGTRVTYLVIHHLNAEVRVA